MLRLSQARAMPLPGQQAHRCIHNKSTSWHSTAWCVLPPHLPRHRGLNVAALLRGQVHSHAAGREVRRGSTDAYQACEARQPAGLHAPSCPPHALPKSRAAQTYPLISFGTPTCGLLVFLPAGLHALHHARMCSLTWSQINHPGTHLPGRMLSTMSLVMSTGARLPGMRAVEMTMSTSLACSRNSAICGAGGFQGEGGMQANGDKTKRPRPHLGRHY